MNWNFELIFKSEEEFNENLNKVLPLANEIKALEGTLNTFDGFKKYFLLNDEFNLLLSKCFVYAHMHNDQNKKDVKYEQMFQTVYGIYANCINILSFAMPELLEVGLDKCLEFINSDNTLECYRFSIVSLFNEQKHVLDKKSENLISSFNNALDVYNNLYDKLAVGDNSSTMVELLDGTELEINESNFRLYLEKLENQEDRRRVFEAVFKFYDKHKNTFAGIYEGIMKSEAAISKIRGYKSILNSHLDGNNIPTEVYESLIKTTRTNTSGVKKYYNILKKHFNLDTIHTYDRFLSLAKDENEYTYEYSKELFFESTAKMGEYFSELSHKVLEDGRVDVSIKDGKRTGAYSTGLYKEGPFILLNHNGSLDSCFTLAHEAGHSMHTLLSNANQSVATADYTIFVAEIASTFNESLLLDHLMSKDLDKNTKIALLQKNIDMILATFYRQSLFANFEYEAHKLVENNEPITYDVLCSIMKSLYKDYYDIDLNNEPYKEMVWAYIPHFFHSPFYVYQYATSFAASMKFYQDVKNNIPHAFDNYLTLLKSGGSDYPVNLVKKAGVDLTKQETFDAVVKRLNELVDELEGLLEE